MSHVRNCELQYIIRHKLGKIVFGIIPQGGTQSSRRFSRGQAVAEALLAAFTDDETLEATVSASCLH